MRKLGRDCRFRPRAQVKSAEAYDKLYSSHAIQGENKVIHVIDQERCTRCGTCFYVCPERIHAVKRVAADALPPALPVDERAIVKQAHKGA